MLVRGDVTGLILVTNGVAGGDVGVVGGLDIATHLQAPINSLSIVAEIAINSCYTIYVAIA